MITVSVPAYMCKTPRGRGGQLKFRFSPYTVIELLRVAILKVNVVGSCNIFQKCVYLMQCDIGCGMLSVIARVIVLVSMILFFNDLKVTGIGSSL